ncbi:hypothetical protein BDC45DRAFT_509539 [Circinella umbellata]|nr:hypothetical protein BDC45DRAFT_509539 [Circinella umbellata]
MGSSAMDLDSSLDDIIKNKKQHKPQHKRQHNTQTHRSSPSTSSRRQQSQNQRYSSSSSSSSRRSTSTFNRSINKNDNYNRRRPATQQARSLITTRHGIQSRPKVVGNSSILQRTSLTSTPRGGFVTKKSISTASLPNRIKSAADPSKIVITKSVSRGRKDEVSASTRPTGFFAGNNNNSNNANSNNSIGNTNFNIRGLSSGINSGMSIRGESGPSIVVISNLDPGANAEDVKTACQQFGQVVRCDVLVDHSGRSFGEAEIEFGNKASALDCISKLDNEVADGRVLRAVLRTRPPTSSLQSMAPPQHSASVSPANFASQTLRSVIAPTRSGYTSAASGKMYSDQILSTQPPQQQQQQQFFQPTRRY